MDTWNPEQYARFRNERSQPFFDLLALVRPTPGMRVVDLGCGTGELTAAMHAELGAAATVGVDNSPAMLASPPVASNLTFYQADLRDWATAQPEGSVDLLFSNACLQWVPDQARVIERLTSLLTNGGQIAIQVPSNELHPAYVAVRDLAARSPFDQALEGHIRRFSNLSLDRYSHLLHKLGYREQLVRQQVYPHLLPTRADILEWLRGSLLTDYQKRLSPELYEQFLTEYRALLAERLPDERPFLYTFERILVWAQR